MKERLLGMDRRIHHNCGNRAGNFRQANRGMTTQNLVSQSPKRAKGINSVRVVDRPEKEGGEGTGTVKNPLMAKLFATEREHCTATESLGGIQTSSWSDLGARDTLKM